VSTPPTRQTATPIARQTCVGGTRVYERPGFQAVGETAELSLPEPETKLVRPTPRWSTKRAR
jgi:hypothetical protein